MKSEEVAAAIRALGSEFNLAQIEATRAVYAPRVSHPSPEAVAGRDLQYGPDPKQRLDLFVTPHSHATILFVHGGGFAQGDKGDAGAPFYNNVAAWALRQGYSAVNLTYRLAPAHPWPNGSQELARALDWLADELPRHDVDPAGIVLMGQSAGGAHVASFLAGHGLDDEPRPRVAGAVMVSGIYDPAVGGAGVSYGSYYGDDASLFESRSSLPGLAMSSVPCLFTLSELDPPLFQKQASAVVATWLAARGQWPGFLWLRAHNHVSSVLQLGSDADTLGPELRRFVDSLGA